jgi:hypothetical protein
MDANNTRWNYDRHDGFAQHVDDRFDRVDEKFERVGEKFERVGEKFER